MIKVGSFWKQQNKRKPNAFFLFLFCLFVAFILFLWLMFCDWFFVFWVVELKTAFKTFNVCLPNIFSRLSSFVWREEITNRVEITWLLKNIVYLFIWVVFFSFLFSILQWKNRVSIVKLSFTIISYGRNFFKLKSFV